jgi:hypothetical protein
MRNSISSLNNQAISCVTMDKQAVLMSFCGLLLLLKKDYRMAFSLYRRGGGGFNLFYQNQRMFAIDYHQINEMPCKRLHFHMGVTKKERAKHRTWNNLGL